MLNCFCCFFIVLNGKRCNFGGENREEWLVSIILSKVELECGLERMKIILGRCFEFEVRGEELGIDFFLKIFRFFGELDEVI